MIIRAFVRNSPAEHSVEVATNDSRKKLEIPAKPGDRGSAVNGGELLMAALATCYCNDLFREAGRSGIQLDEVEVMASADFPGVGLNAENIRYAARIKSPASREQISLLLAETDKVAEVHNTIRTGVPVTLQEWI